MELDSQSQTQPENLVDEMALFLLSQNLRENTIGPWGVVHCCANTSVLPPYYFNKLSELSFPSCLLLTQLFFPLPLLPVGF